MISVVILVSEFAYICLIIEGKFNDHPMRSFLHYMYDELEFNLKEAFQKNRGSLMVVETQYCYQYSIVFFKEFSYKNKFQNWFRMATSNWNRDDPF